MSKLQEFNNLKNEAKALGIDVKGMKKADIEAAIAQAQNVPSTPEIPEDPEAPEAPEVQAPKMETAINEEVKKQLGRPVNPESTRQKVLAEKAALREAGLLKRGRPIVEGSPRQLREAARAAKIAAGIELKPGRPKMIKVEAPVVPAAEALVEA